MEQKEYELTDENYHSLESRMEYMGSSQFKDFLTCEVMALAKIKGEYVEEPSKSLLLGSYVDAYFSGELEKFKNTHPDIFNSKTGELKSDFKKGDDIIRAIESDEGMSNALAGEKQVIMIGTIAGVPFKIKMDAYHKAKAIVDQKIMAKLDERYWIKNEEGRNTQVDFIKAFRYDIQGAIYQEIEKQNTKDKKLPFIIAATSTQNPPSKKLIELDQETLDLALEEVIQKAPRFQRIKQGLEKPKGCGKCAVCRSKANNTRVITYSKYKQELDENENDSLSLTF